MSWHWAEKNPPKQFLESAVVVESSSCRWCNSTLTTQLLPPYVWFSIDTQVIMLNMLRAL